ncbi:MAG: hypothetical protein IJ723_05590 [Ruminococcus sp.]|nr:hypothetical protein [Ruminococcus sp.]
MRIAFWVLVKEVIAVCAGATGLVSVSPCELSSPCELLSSPCELLSSEVGWVCVPCCVPSETVAVTAAVPPTYSV